MRRILPSVRVRAIRFASAMLAIFAGSATAQSPFDGLKFRSIGPAVMGGRIHAIAVDPRDNAVIYVGAASGGMWKTTNKGTTWAPVFEGQADNTFGDIAISPVDSRIVWAGTGESWIIRYSDVMGDGVYKSTDAGATWKNMGLRETGRIARVIVHPTNANTIYVCAVGRASSVVLMPPPLPVGEGRGDAPERPGGAGSPPRGPYTGLNPHARVRVRTRRRTGQEHRTRTRRDAHPDPPAGLPPPA